MLAEPGSDPISFGYSNIYGLSKRSDVSPQRPGYVEFDSLSFAPVLVSFTTELRLQRGQRSQLRERPVLVLLPGDTVRVTHHAADNTFSFRGRHQAELDFCVRLWQGSLSLSGLDNRQAEVVGTDSTITYWDPQRSGWAARSAQPLAQYLQQWSQWRVEAEGQLARLRGTPGLRPEVAASLNRHLRLRVFARLLRPAHPTSRHDSLRTFPAAYRDTVAAYLPGILALQTLPAAAAEGLAWALHSYITYQCVLARQFPSLGARYLQAKQTLSGFHRAWVCFLILNEGPLRRPDIRYRLQDYVRWVASHQEFVRVLRGEPSRALRSYPHAAFSDSLTSATNAASHLTDLLATQRGKVVLLDLWASWCAPCQEEMPASVALTRRYGARGLVVLYLSVDQERAAWQKALRQLPAGTRQHYRFRQPKASAFLQAFDVRTVPRYILLDRSGIVRDPDAVRPSDPRLRDILEKLL
ncbi:TlpA family protein disulfide reductase [Hymenobacter crusticola]|uniref:TlpA family protein disulfide reductase n=1 Tax=Hymenobacter crusticola TaxID=1770526 RepID=UPI0015C4F2CF|nr:TlpA disulfide reductase family protein [Hymenobacter crusticola]